MASVYDLGSTLRDSLVSLYEFTIGRFINTLFPTPVTILFLGIDNAGKTTLVNKLKTNQNHIFLPTKHPMREVVEIGNMKATILVVGGHSSVRFAWKTYFSQVDGLIFLVDTGAEDRFNEAREAWQMVSQLAENTPTVVLMNKIDNLGLDTSTIQHRPDVTQELESKLGIVASHNVNPIYLSIIRENTYDKNSVLCKAFTWLSDRVKENKRK